jgi:hypothetical protein
MVITSIEKFDGITVEQKGFIDPIMKGVGLASATALILPPPASRELLRLDFAMAAALQSVNSLLAAASTKCTLDAPPADIDLVTDASGGLIYRCHHKHAHRWKLDGTKM